ncbi:phosphoribosylaminoimidazolesuccinocarboxamide synthase [Desulfothermus okinawensis JCM 13304]
MQIVTKTNITEYPLISRGKVRDIYEIDKEKLLIVTTDRMSAFDVILPDPIPYKGVILNLITIFWMEKFKDLVPNHLIETELKNFPSTLQKYSDELEKRSVIVKKANPLEIECIVRGYITGSGWKDYQKTGSVCGHKLPNGLVESEKLPQPIFTPSTKAEVGEHDINITVSQAAEKIGKEIFEKVQEISINIYKNASEYAWDRGIIIADTKFEFGMINNELVLIDEVLTPDSSRFWPKDEYEKGRSQKSFDKQYLRDWLSKNWDKKSPPPRLPEEIIENTKNRYLEALLRLTGNKLNIGG